MEMLGWNMLTADPNLFMGIKKDLHILEQSTDEGTIEALRWFKSMVSK